MQYIELNFFENNCGEFCVWVGNGLVYRVLNVFV